MYMYIHTYISILCVIVRGRVYMRVRMRVRVCVCACTCRERARKRVRVCTPISFFLPRSLACSLSRTHTHTHMYPKTERCRPSWANAPESRHTHKLCELTHTRVWHTSLIYACNVNQSGVCRDSFTCVPWLIHMCAMTSSYGCHDSHFSVTS